MNNDWETANYEALMFSLRPYESKLSVTRNSKLNSKDREIDVRIITDLPELPESELKAKLKNHAIARAFKKHNIVELKNPGEALSINTFWKGISYAAQYKSDGKDDSTGETGVNSKPMSDITLTFLRVAKPIALFKYITEHGFSVEESTSFKGIYYVSGIPELLIQIVDTSELEGDEFVALRVQKKNAKEEDIRKFLQLCREAENPADKYMADTVLQVSIVNNKDTYEKILKEEEEMCQALEELLKDRIETKTRASYEEGRAEGSRSIIERLRASGMLSEEQAAVALGWSL